MQPILPPSVEFCGHVADDFDTFLDPAQRERLREVHKTVTEGIDRVENLMKRWAEGGYQTASARF